MLPANGASKEALDHLLADVMGCLPLVSCSIGHLHPPASSAFNMPIGGNDEVALVLKKCWESIVVLVPVYLAKGVKVKMLVDSETNPEILSDLDAKNGTEMVYLRKGVKLKLFCRALSGL